MSNDNGSVDEYEKLGMQKKEIEGEEEVLRNKIIALIKQEVSREIIELTKNEKAFRLSFREI